MSITTLRRPGFAGVSETLVWSLSHEPIGEPGPDGRRTYQQLLRLSTERGRTLALLCQDLSSLTWRVYIYNGVAQRYLGSFADANQAQAVAEHAVCKMKQEQR